MLGAGGGKKEEKKKRGEAEKATAQLVPHQ